MTDTSERRDVGRPRLYADDAIFRAVSLVLRRDGHSELTLELVAQEVGCTRQALVRRFGSKRALLLAALDASGGKIASDYNQARDATPSPLTALHDRYTRPPNSRPEMGDDPRPQANTLAYILTTCSDPDFAQRFAGLVDVSMSAIRQLLQSAVEQGELQPVDIPALTRTLHAAWTGETINWCTDQSTPYAVTMSAMFEQIIGPYRVAPSS